MKPFHFTIEQKIFDRLKSLKKTHGVAVTDFIRIAIREKLERDYPELGRDL